jgi:hypothetical protein
MLPNQRMQLQMKLNHMENKLNKADADTPLWRDRYRRWADSFPSPGPHHAVARDWIEYHVVDELKKAHDGLHEQLSSARQKLTNQAELIKSLQQQRNRAKNALKKISRVITDNNLHKIIDEAL